MKTTFLAWLAGKIAETQEPVDTDSPVEKGEEVLGVMSDALKILSTVYMKESASLCGLFEKHVLLHTDPDTPHDPNVCEEIRAEISVCEARTAALKMVFWQEVNEEFAGGADMNHIGLRQGFLIVKLTEQEEGQSHLEVVFKIPPIKRQNLIMVLLSKLRPSRKG